MGAGIAVFLLWLTLQPEHHNPPPDLHPKHDQCCGFKGCSRHQHFNGRWCGIPWRNE